MRIEGTAVEADRLNTLSPVLLSHYHRDHMGGLDRRAAGTVYCSTLTTALLRELDGVPEERLRPVEIGECFEPAPGVRSSALESNHCAGAVMFHVETPRQRILYTGDFRLNDVVRRQCAALAPVDVLYLDTTYDAPRYRFPPQQEAIARVLDLIRSSAASEVFLAAYTLGKDRVLEAVWREFGEPIYATEQKRRVCRILGLEAMVTGDREATRFRCYSRGYFERYFSMRRRRDALVIIPTGWAVDAASCNPAYEYVPYSEHCDYAELQEFRALVRPKRVVPLR